MIDQLFHVATEFQFDISQAVLSTNMLQNQVNQVSEAADNALLSFQKLGAGIVAHLGLGSGGLLAVLGKAVQISDKFNSSALSFSNVISSNMKVFSGTIGSFNERLETSKMIMGDINKVANQFALPSGELLNLTKLLTPLLAIHGMAGTNFSGSINMAKNVLKSAPNLNLNVGDIQNQLLNAVSGQAHMQGTLFPRLMKETSAFTDAHVTSASQFNSLTPEKRIALLNKALAIFASDTDVLKNRVNSLSGQLTILGNNVVEFGSVLRPIGDAILKPVVKVLQELNHYIDNQGRDLAKSMGAMISNIFEDPKNLLINIMQLKQLGADTRKGAKLFGFMEMFFLLGNVAKFLGITTAGPWKLIGMGLTYVGQALMFLWRLTPVLTIFKFAASAAWFAFSKLLPNMLGMVMVLQTISRAQAIAKVNDVSNMLTLAPRLADLTVRFKTAIENIFLPISTAIDWLANFIAPLFKVSTWLNIVLDPLEAFATILEGIGRISIMAWAGLQGVFFGLYQFVDNIRSGKLLGAFGGVGKAFSAGVDDILEKNWDRMNGKAGGVTANQVTNIAKVEIRNDFKENQEPDRIAFTIKDQLLKAKRNATQGKGTALQSAFAR